jgi:hypothetical protein
MAALAKSAADLVGSCSDTDPTEVAAPSEIVFHRRGLALGRELPISLFDDFFHLPWVQVASKLGVYCSGMHSSSPYPVVPAPSVESNREEDVGRLLWALRHERFIRRPLED